MWNKGNPPLNCDNCDLLPQKKICKLESLSSTFKAAFVFPNPINLVPYLHLLMFFVFLCSLALMFQCGNNVPHLVWTWRISDLETWEPLNSAYNIFLIDKSGGMTLYVTWDKILILWTNFSSIDYKKEAAASRARWMLSEVKPLSSVQ